MSGPTFRRLELGPVRDALARYARKLGERPGVLCVLLFGSLARGTHTGSSDADLLVVLESSPQAFHLRGADLADPFLPVPADLFVYTADEARQALGVRGSVVRQAFETGQVLFERTPGWVAAWRQELARQEEG